MPPQPMMGSRPSLALYSTAMTSVERLCKGLPLRPPVCVFQLLCKRSLWMVVLVAMMPSTPFAKTVMQ